MCTCVHACVHVYMCACMRMCVCILGNASLWHRSTNSIRTEFRLLSQLGNMHVRNLTERVLTEVSKLQYVVTKAQTTSNDVTSNQR